jgi:hypothetical protein
VQCPPMDQHQRRPLADHLDMQAHSDRLTRSVRPATVAAARYRAHGRSHR